MNEGGTVPLSNVISKVGVEGCETPVKADREEASRRLNRSDECLALPFGDGHGLLNEHVLARLKCGQRETGVIHVAVCQDNEVHRGIIEDSRVIRSGVSGSKPERVALSSCAAARADSL